MSANYTLKIFGTVLFVWYQIESAVPFVCLELLVGWNQEKAEEISSNLYMPEAEELYIAI